jgi:RNA recognition motif-containing protein
MEIHVTNLHLNVIESDLQRMFNTHGEVKSVELVRDKLNNRSRGRAFISMPVDKQAEAAISVLHGSEFRGKILSVTRVNYDPSFSTHLISSKE